MRISDWSSDVCSSDLLGQPARASDFAWAFFGRFTIYMGYQGVITYMLYILQDYIGLSLADANRTIATLSTVTFFALVFAAFTSGLLSDRIGRRKPIVFASRFILGAVLPGALSLPPDLQSWVQGPRVAVR